MWQDSVMTIPIFCRFCHYDLRSVLSESCPECGRTFDVTKPKTFSTMGKAPSFLLSLLVVFMLGIVAFFSLWSVAFTLSYGIDRYLAFWGIFGTALAFGIVAGILAALKRFLLIRISSIVIGVLCIWAGLFLASDKFYRVWQAMPNASAEAYSDSAPAGVLVLGWIPAIFLLSLVIMLTLCLRWVLNSLPRKPPPPPLVSED